MACYGIRGESVFASRVERGTMENRFSLGRGYGGGSIGKLKRPKSSNRPRGGEGLGGSKDFEWISQVVCSGIRGGISLR